MHLKNSGDSTGFEPMTSAMPVQCSNQSWVRIPLSHLNFSGAWDEINRKHLCLKKFIPDYSIYRGMATPFFHMTFLSREKNSFNNGYMSFLITTGNYWSEFQGNFKNGNSEGHCLRLQSCNTRVYLEFRRDESRNHISTNENLEGAMVQTTSYFTFASFSISVVPRFASAIVGAESVVAEGISVAHGRGCRTFIDIYYKKAKTNKQTIIISRGAFNEKSTGAGSTNCMLATTKTRAEVRHTKTIFSASF